MDIGLAECGTEFEPVETVVCSEESIRDSLDFQEEEYCEEQVDDQADVRNMAAAQPDSPPKSNGVSDTLSVPNGCQTGTVGAIAHQEFWNMFTGLKIKQYSDQELEAFKGPFLKGWRREVVLRGTVSNSGKKIGDVYYYSPDKKTKLRSYVEMGLFLRKNSGCGLEPENFTFARQPVYKPPEEIVRHAMTRGSNQSIDHFVSASPSVAAPPAPPPPVPVLTPIVTPTAPSAKAQVVTRRSQSTAETPETPDSGQTEGRAKRKRVAPTRFEDEEYLDNSPFKKKTEKQPIRSEKTISPMITPTIAAAAVPTGLSKTIETKVNAQGRTSIIIRTPIRKVSGTTQLDARNTTVAHNAIGTTAKAAPDVKEKLDVNQGVSVSSFETTDKDAGSSSGSDSKSVTRPEEVAESPMQQNGLQDSTKLISSAPPPLQPIRAATSGQPVTPAAVRKESRPVVQPTNSLQPNMRKSSIVNKNGRSILSQNANSMRVSSDQGSGFKPIRPKPTPRAEMAEEMERMEGQGEDGAPVPPCSIMCGGRQGQLPSLLCSRCLCLFHPQCVQRGIHLNQGNQFVCPNCIQPSDQGRPVSLMNGSDESAGTSARPTGKLQPSSRNSSRGPSPLHFATSLIRNQQTKSSSGFKSQPQQNRASITTMMDKRQQSQLQLLQTFRQIAGIRSKNSTSGRPVISRPTPVRKHQVVQNRGHLRLSAAIPGRESRSLFPQNQVRVSKTRDALTPPSQQEQPEAPAAPAPSNHQHLSELISHHLDSVSKLLQEITMLKYSNCQKASTSAPTKRKRSNSV